MDLDLGKITYINKPVNNCLPASHGNTCIYLFLYFFCPFRMDFFVFKLSYATMLVTDYRDPVNLLRKKFSCFFIRKLPFIF